jgi:putative peptide maturation system protein
MDGGMSGGIKGKDGAAERALLAAARLLRELPRGRQMHGAARGRFAEFARGHAGARPQLVGNLLPGGDGYEFDLLLGLGGEGTLALSWHPEDGVPWTPKYSDHWAVNYVLTVNGQSTTIQSALLYLGTLLKRRPDLMTDLVNRSLVQAAMESEVIVIEEARTERAVELFRRGQGLEKAEDMRRWLQQTGLTLEAVYELVEETLRVEEFRKRLVAGKAAPWFAQHKADFERITVLEVEAATPAAARRLAAAARRGGLGDTAAKAEAQLLATRSWRCHAHELAGGADDGVHLEGRVLRQVIRREPAKLDAATCGHIEGLLYQRWLAQARAQAQVQWHWM